MKKYITPIAKEVNVNLAKPYMITVSGKFNGQYDAKEDHTLEWDNDDVFGL